MGYKYYSHHLSTFDSVQSWYERTKPVVSKIHKREDDIRPIGNRSRKWERIEKINNNCYALLGAWGVDGIHYYNSRNVENRVSGKDIRRTAPIVWERNPKTGEEFVIVHNARTGFSTRWYEFLRSYLPGRMSLPRRTDGRQYVTTGPDSYYLPYNGYMAEALAKNYHRLKDKELAEARRPSSERKLVFKRVESEFVLVSEQYELVHKARTLVSRDEKAMFREEIRDFKAFALTMAPVLAGVSDDERREIVAGLILEATGEKRGCWGDWWRYIDTNTRRLALLDPQSPMRLAMVYGFLAYAHNCDWYVSRDRKGSPDLVRFRLNNFVNSAFGFIKPNK
jgi:hypothetical protein